MSVFGTKKSSQAFVALSWDDDNASDSEFFKEYVANDDKQKPSQAAMLDDFIRLAVKLV